MFSFNSSIRSSCLVGFTALLIFGSVAYGYDPCDPSPIEEQGFWAETFWGTSEDPGILRGAFNWLSNMMLGLLSSIIGMFLSVLPGDLALDSSQLKYYFEVANAWLPVDLGFFLMFAYWAFLGVFCGVKFILKLIPTIG